MPIPDPEDLFRFISPRDYDGGFAGEERIKRSLFTQSTGVSFNRGSIWDRSHHAMLLESNPELQGKGYGLCSMTAQEFRGLPEPSANPVDVLPAPIDPPEVDALLMIPNPAHASATRKLSEGEARRAAAIALRSLHVRPQRLG